MAEYRPLKVRACDAEDVQILAALFQDGLFRCQDLEFDAQARTLTIRFNRFCHECEDAGQRVISALQVGQVLGLKSKGLVQAKDTQGQNSFYMLLDMLLHTEGDDPELRLICAEDVELRLKIEEIDIIACDLSPPWRTKRPPQHDE